MHEISENDLFYNLSENEIDYLLSQARMQEIAVGEELVTEGDPGDEIYYILSGDIDVYKSTGTSVGYVIATLTKGNVAGEMMLIERGERSATLRGKTPAKVLVFDMIHIESRPEISAQLRTNVSIILARRLKYINEVTVHSLQQKNEENEKRIGLATFMTSTLFLLSIFTLALMPIKYLHSILGRTEVISTLMLYLIAIFNMILIKHSHFPLKTFGLTLHRWRYNIVSGLLWSLPVMLVLVAIKWVLIQMVPAMQGAALFDGWVPFMQPKLRWGLYLGVLLAYASTCPLQELIVRGSLQSSIQRFLPVRRSKAVFIAILLSNLVFAAMHTHTSVLFAFSVLFLGLFWGWMYYKHDSLVGVSASHIVVGCFAAFVLGMGALF